jgi:hypothetical protein
MYHPVARHLLVNVTGLTVLHATRLSVKLFKKVVSFFKSYVGVVD